MNARMIKPLFTIASFALIVSMACSMTTAATPTPVPPPTKEAVQEATKAPEPTKEVVVEPTKEVVAEATKESPKPAPKNVVTGLENVKDAMVYINVEGTWREPEGLDQNVGYLGSGFIIDPSGIAVTNNHVVTGAALLKVYVGDETEPRSAKVLGVSECSDLAVIDIEGDGFTYFEWSDKVVKEGTQVYAVGYPGGLYTLTDGIISATNVPGRTPWSSVKEVLQHTAKINPGNSGGPLVTADGKVIGINYASISSADRNLSISPEEALPVINQLQAGKDVDSIGINGITLVDYTDADGNPLYGIWVRSVKPGSPADKARILPGDILYSLSGQVLATDGTMGDYCDILRSHSAGDTVDMEVIRYDTMEVLAGQLNGRELETSAVVATESPSDNPVADGDYYTVYDDTGAIAVDVPATWDQVDGAMWSNTWSGYNFDAASIVATSDFDSYNNWAASGIWFAASKDWGNIGGYVQLLDGVKDWYSSDCDFDNRGDYGADDPVFEGKYDLWTNCGSAKSTNIVIAARPKNDTSYLVIVMVQIMNDADLEAVNKILDTFDLVGSLP
jgi:serine protease Do